MEVNIWLFMGLSFLFLPLCVSRSYLPGDNLQYSKLPKSKLEERINLRDFGAQSSTLSLKRKHAKQHLITKRKDMKLTKSPSSVPTSESYYDHLPLFKSPKYSTLSNRRSSQLNSKQSVLPSHTKSSQSTPNKFLSKLVEKLFQLQSSSSSGDCVYWTSPEGTRHLLKRLKGQNGSDLVSDCRPKRSTFSRPYYAPGSSMDLVEPLI